jgi:hypothetical protein
VTIAPARLERTVVVVTGIRAGRLQPHVSCIPCFAYAGRYGVLEHGFGCPAQCSIVIVE